MINEERTRTATMRYTDHTGARFTRLLVLERIANARNGARGYRCQCDCGATINTTAGLLVSGHTKSCGCLKRETKSRLKHGGKGTTTYKRWRSMRSRCTNKKDSSYANYGAKGVTVCDRWIHSYENFLADMGECPSETMTLDRIENELGYEPGNCRWATSTEQNRNRSNNRMLTLNGETECIATWAERTGIDKANISNRLRLGWTVEKALTTHHDARAGREIPSRRKTP